MCSLKSLNHLNCSLVFHDRLCILLSRLVYGSTPLGVGEVHVEQSKANTEAFSPFKVVQQRPRKVTTDIDPIFINSCAENTEMNVSTWKHWACIRIIEMVQSTTVKINMATWLTHDKIIIIMLILNCNIKVPIIIS